MKREELKTRGYYLFITDDDYEVTVYVLNKRSYSCKVFIANNQNEDINSTNCTEYSLEGRDKCECLLNEGAFMTKAELIQMFF